MLAPIRKQLQGLAAAIRPEDKIVLLRTQGTIRVSVIPAGRPQGVEITREISKLLDIPLVQGGLVALEMVLIESMATAIPAIREVTLIG